MPLTTVIVSQRVSSVRDADLICVMRRGKVVGMGTHDDLLHSCEVYQEICLSQLKREELGIDTPVSGGTMRPGAKVPLEPSGTMRPGVIVPQGEGVA